MRTEQTFVELANLRTFATHSICLHTEPALVSNIYLTAIAFDRKIAHLDHYASTITFQARGSTIALSEC